MLCTGGAGGTVAAETRCVGFLWYQDNRSLSSGILDRRKERYINGSKKETNVVITSSNFMTSNKVAAARQVILSMRHVLFQVISWFSRVRACNQASGSESRIFVVCCDNLWMFLKIYSDSFVGLIDIFKPAVV